MPFTNALQNHHPVGVVAVQALDHEFQKKSVFQCRVFELKKVLVWRPKINCFSFSS
ncbi:hypothetical protein SynMEDNS5_02730 [Synechococcus sp. MEDNS5]|nr:hypothetical protein SynMEDNS5_02730 [Synechococcus sp. MEDNS5]